MKMNIVVAALALALAALVAMPQASSSAGEAYTVMATAYTCDPHPSNPFRCGVLRWGGDLNAPGMACPVTWKNRYMEVPGYGVRRCDDTGAYDYLRGLPHIDIRVATYEEARAFGVRRMTIYAAGGASATPVPTPSPTPTPTIDLTTAGGAVTLALRESPRGDGETALARLLYLSTARRHFGPVLSTLTLPATQPVWAVTLWVPPSEIPTGTKPTPNADGDVAAKFFLFDAKSGALLLEEFVSREVVETMGWIPQDSIPLDK